MNCKVLELPDLCRCLLASQGIMLATFVSVLKNYLQLESKKHTNKILIFPNYNLWSQLGTYFY